MPAKRKFFTCISILILTFLPMGIGCHKVHAIGFDPFTGDPVSVRSYVSFTSVPQGGSLRIALELLIENPWHINAHKVNDPYLIPTKVSFDPPAGISLREIVYPHGIEKILSFSESPLLLYSHRALIGAALDFSPDFPEGETKLNFTIVYQACDNTRCLAPIEKAIEIPIKISSPYAAIDIQYPEVFAQIKFRESLAGDQGESSTSVSQQLGEKEEPGAAGEVNRLQNLMETKGIIFIFLMVFLGGLALNLTPCVYPIIPITVSYFGGQSGGKSSRTLFLAILYVLGIATMYSSLGLLAALTGSMLGTALQNPMVLLLIALVLVALALSMFGLYEIRIPTALSNLAGTSKQGALGAFLMGLTVGVVAAPCIGPFVLGLLTFVGESGNPILGFFMFFTLAAGLGLPFIALAVLSGSISKLPRSGEWMEWVRKLFGVILVAMAIYFLEPVLGNILYFLLLGLMLISSGIVLGFILKTTSTQTLFFMVFRRFVGIALPLLGMYLIFAPGHIIARGGTEGIPWKPFDVSMLEEARKASTPVIIDFYADWCLPCKELDYRTFSQPEVIRETEGILALKADLTRAFSKEVKKLREEYIIKGVPTIVFLDAGGKERKDLRILGFVNKTDFSERLKKLKSGFSG